MFTIKLKNNKSFPCPENLSIFEAAKQSDVHLEHSCLTARCRSCVAQVITGNTNNIQEEFVLSKEERNNGYILTCNSIPKSDLDLNLEDLGDITIYPKKIYPSKIDAIEYLTKDVIKIVLRFPPNVNFKFNAGQYVNLIKNNINRSYSIANFSENKLEFFIKNYQGGEMSEYWFNHAKLNDLVRVEGPLGTFFLRDSEKKNIVFLATGTGVAPIKSILEGIDQNDKLIQGKNLFVFVGGRYKSDLFWKPKNINNNINYTAVLSREDHDFEGFKGYVQNAVLEQNIDLKNSQVYACGSSEMISSAKKTFINHKLEENHFFSDAFVQTN